MKKFVAFAASVLLLAVAAAALPAHAQDLLDKVKERGKLIVGVNAFQETDEKPMEILQVDPHVEHEQVQALKRLKKSRDAAAAKRALDEVRRIAATAENLLPSLLNAADARCTVGELMLAIADVFGRYRTAGLM